MTVERYKSLVLTKMWAIRAVLVTGVIISYVSLVQTISAFSDWSDPNIPFIGMYIPHVMGVFFQYGQTVALYMKERFGNNKPIYDLAWFTSNNIWITVFIFCGVIDAASNIIWFENTVVQKVKGNGGNIALYRIMAYPLLVLTVMVEEGLAWVSEGHRKIVMEYKAIRESEKRVLASSQNSQSRDLRSSGNGNGRADNKSLPYSPSRFNESSSASMSARPAEKYSYSPVRTTTNKPEPSYHTVMPKPSSVPTQESLSSFDDDDDDVAEYLARKNR